MTVKVLAQWKEGIEVRHITIYGCGVCSYHKEDYILLFKS